MDAPVTASGQDVEVASRRHSRWLSAALFLVALALVVVVVAGTHSNGNLFNGPSAIALAGEQFKLVKGRGRPVRGGFVLDALDSAQLAIVSAPLQGFAAEHYPRVDCEFRGLDPDGVELSFLWRTLEHPNLTFHVELQAQASGVASASSISEDFSIA